MVAAQKIKRVAPREFADFVATFKVFEDSLNNELRIAGPNVIFTAQGKAQLVSSLRAKFERIE